MSPGFCDDPLADGILGGCRQLVTRS